MDQVYGVWTSESNAYICWEPRLKEKYRIFTLDSRIDAINVSPMEYQDLTRDQKLYIQAESSGDCLPSERIQVQIEGILFVIR